MKIEVIVFFSMEEESNYLMSHLSGVIQGSHYKG